MQISMKNGDMPPKNFLPITTVLDKIARRDKLPPELSGLLFRQKIYISRRLFSLGKSKTRVGLHHLRKVRHSFMHPSYSRQPSPSHMRTSLPPLPLSLYCTCQKFWLSIRYTRYKSSMHLNKQGFYFLCGTDDGCNKTAAFLNLAYALCTVQ